MEINLLNIQPHQVSRDMRGYIVFFYGDPKSGKTTTAVQFPNSLLLAAEKGYNAIPGVMAQPINTWGEFKKVLRQLKDPAVKEKFETIILDTVDLFYDYCVKYICENAKRSDGGFGVDTIGDIAYGKGYTLVKQEFDECLRSVVNMGYGLVMISHAVDKSFKDEVGNEFNKIVPTLDKGGTNIVSRMADIYGYSRGVTLEDGTSVTKLFLRGTSRYAAGSRFKYTPEHIDFTYENLVNTIADAIDMQMKETNKEYFTETRNNLYQVTELDFDALMEEFNSIIKELTETVPEEEFISFWQPRIIEITDKRLGKGFKVSQCSREQTDVLSLIIDDLQALVKANKK